MAHDRTTPECEERFRAIDHQLAALADLAQGTARTVRGENGTPGIVTSLALVAQRLESVEERLVAMESTPHEVRKALEAKLDTIACQIKALPPSGSPPSLADMVSPVVKVALAALGLVGTVLAILAAVLGVQIGGGP